MLGSLPGLREKMRCASYATTPRAIRAIPENRPRFRATVSVASLKRENGHFSANRLVDERACLFVLVAGGAIGTVEEEQKFSEVREREARWLPKFKSIIRLIQQKPVLPLPGG